MQKQGYDEIKFIKWIRKNLGRRSSLVIDIGDDSACFRINKKYYLLTNDQIIDGTHFISRTTLPRLIGRKAVARCISDIAAMGGYPIYALVTIAVPQNIGQNTLKKIFNGMKDISKRFGMDIIGGDVSSTKGKLTITTTIFGSTGTRKPITRSGAKSGEAIFVTGKLGGSLKTGKHLKFYPKVKQGMILAQKYPVNSMIDVSDGLVIDLYRLCQESGVGAVLFEKDIPVNKSVQLRSALYDGEDYELLFTGKIQRVPFASKIGKIIDSKKSGIFMQTKSGKIVKLDIRGYVHTF